MNFFLKRWLSDSTTPAHVPAVRRKLGIENLEDRTVPAIVIPEVPTTTQVTTGAVSEVAVDQYNPLMALNPVDPNQIAMVASEVRYDGNGNAVGAALVMNTSTDRGASWVPQGTIITTQFDPMTLDAGGGMSRFAVIDSPSIAYDRLGNVYVAHIQRNVANTSGALVLSKYSIDANGTPAFVSQQNIYRWANQDPIFHAVVGVNNLVTTFTDPVTGQVNPNFGAGRGVYVAWNTAATQSTSANGNRFISPSVIQMVVSDDGGASFSSPQFVSDNGFQVGGSGGFPRDTGVNPQIYFTHNSVTNAIQGGLVGFTWQHGTTDIGTPESITATGIFSDLSDPLNGNLANPLTVQQSFAGSLTGSAPAVGDLPALNTTTGVIAGAGTPTNGVLTARTTTFTTNITVNATGFTTLADMELSLAMFAQERSLLRAVLTSPTGVQIVLFNSRQSLDGTGALVNNFDGADPAGFAPGIGGIGEQAVPNGVNWVRSTGTVTGLVFDQQGARRVNDPATVAPYILRLRPEGGSLNNLNGLTAAQLSGNWTLAITNHKVDATDGTTRSTIDRYSFKFVSRVNTTQFAADSPTGVTPATSTATNVGTLSIASPTAGVQGWYSVATDNTQGSDSPYQGRTYIAYTDAGGGANDTDIFVAFSDDGVIWSTPTRVNDDFSTTDFAEDNRAQFQPQITVDPTTGTLVVMWYDARWDASNGRVATFMSTSVDGGVTFSPNRFLNFTKSAVDAIDRTTVEIEPVPNNLALLNTVGRSFGDHQALVAYGGTVVPVWTGNANEAGAAFDSRARLLTTVVNVAAGPRIIQGDMGPISDVFMPQFGNGAVTNDSVSIDGTRQLTGIYVRLDRAVDPTTFTASDVQLRYRDTTTTTVPGVDPSQDISNQVVDVIPLDAGGTKTYSSIGPVTGTNATVNGTNVNTANSVISVGLAPAPNVLQAINGVRVSLGGGSQALTQDLVLTLTAPDGLTTVTLANRRGGPTTIASAFANTNFFMTAPTPIATTEPPYLSVRPDGNLNTFVGLVAAGDWTLTAVNGAGEAVTILSWSLDLVTLDVGASRYKIVVAPQTRVGTYSYAIGPDIRDQIRHDGQLGNQMDQNGNGIPNESFTTTFTAVGAVNVGAGTVAVPTVGTRTLNVTGLQTNTTFDVNVRMTLTGPVGGLATVRLIGPDGTAVVLYDQSVAGSANQLFANTTFDDQSANTLAGAPANTQIVTVRPIGSLTAVQGLNNGVWRLQVTNREGGTVTIQNFALDFTQNTSDIFSNPTSANSGFPFTLPYTTDSLPLIIPGPRVVSTTPGLTADGSASYLDVVFSQDMRATSFTPAQVLELRTPQGTSFTSGFTVTANPPGTDPRLALRTFRITFPPQSLSGYYSLLLGPNILSATGLAMDPNMNAGVELVTGRVANPVAGSTVSADINTGFIGVNVPPAVDANTPGVATVTIPVTDPFFITQQLGTPIKVRLDIAVADTRNLSARLIAPDGTVIQLFTNPGRSLGPFANFTGTVLTDFAPLANLIQNQGAPFTNGPFLPQQNLSVLNGHFSAGVWRLEISNRSTSSGATVNSWGLSLPKPILSSGLGETVSDNTTLGFRVFTTKASQPLASTAWTPVGPTQGTDMGTGEQVNGSITVTAIDPSDPSGNTVYAGSSRGGLWKTSNFLTLDAVGPTWIPLLDAAATKALRISSIAIIPRNNDPTQQSIILVGTGDPTTQAGGVGFLRSTDGGRSFRLIDSTVNADAQTNILPVESASRDHLFSINNSYVYKVVVDPVRQTNGEFYMYAAVGGDAAVAGLWRSVDSGRSWVRQMAGEATDFVLAANRVDVTTDPNNPSQPISTLRNADIAYVAFATSANAGAAAAGVYTTQNIIGATPVLFNLDNGGGGKPLFSNGTSNIGVANSIGNNPNKAPTKILLGVVTPPAGSDPNTIRVYQGWLYALVIGGTAPGLYMTKDFGANWVLVQTQTTTFLDPLTGLIIQSGVLTNDETEPLFDMGTTVPTTTPPTPPKWNSLVVDPTDPNVVYIGASNVLTSANGTEFVSTDAAGIGYSDGGVFRVDVSTINDAHAQVARDNSAGGVGTQAEAASTGGLIGGPTGYNPITFAATATPYFNRIRDPNNPFVSGATQIIAGTQFTNTGVNAQVSRFRGVSGDALIRNIQTVFDPLTRKTRLIISTDRGVFTAVDGADPDPTQGIYANAVVETNIGSAVVVTGNRSTNLALADGTSTAVQPTTLAGDLAGLYNRLLVDPFTGDPLPPEQQNSLPGESIYLVSDGGYLNGPAGVLAPSSTEYGQDQWKGEVTTDAYLLYAGDTTQWRYTGQVETDPQGSGTIYQYRAAPFALTGGGPEVDLPGNSTDIFYVTLPGQEPIGRSNGLYDVGQGNTVDQGIWASVDSAVFSVNPGDASGIVIASPIGGRVFLTTDQGLNWFAIDTTPGFNPTQSVGTALAFGGKDPTRGVNDFIYDGTADGKIWVTRNAGGTWTDISAGLPTGANAGPILKIIANPRAGTYDAYAITATGVFYKADARTAAAWVNITGNLLTVRRTVFGEASTLPALTQFELTALAVDWRYDQPVLYTGSDTGVYRSTNGGTTWALFPAIANGATAEGGYLPAVKVTDLDLVYGALNPTGVPDQTTAKNVLVATTYGRGLFSIRIDPATVPAGLGTSGPWVNTTNSAPTLTAPAAATGLASISVTFGDPDNAVPANQVFLRIDASTLNVNTMSIVGPNGVKVPFTVTDISGTVPGSGTGESLANKFRFDFTPTVTGTYRLQMNTGVLDVSGRRMNQDRDGTNGEEPADYFVSQNFAITVNQPPTISAVPNQGLLVGATSTPPLTFTVGDPETAAGSLVVTVTTSNPTVLPLGNIVLGGTGAARTVTVTPAAAGTSTVTLTVTDAGGRQTSTSFLVSAVVSQAVPFTDTFTRSDANDLGGNWVLQTGTAAVSNGSAIATSPLAIGTINNLTQLDSSAQGTINVLTTGTASGALIARYSGPGDNNMYIGGVVVQNGVTTARIVRYVNGTATVIAQSSPLPVAASYVVRFDVVNDSLKLFINGQLSVFAYDTGIATAGLTGFRMTQASRLDDYTDDNINLLPVPLPAVPGQTAIDTFTQANGTQLTRFWRDRVGNLSVTGNAAVGQAPLNLSTYNVPATANIGAQTVVGYTAVGQTVGIALRYSGPGATNLYWGTLSALAGGQQQAAIWRNVNGTWSQLAVTTLNSSGGVLRFEANGPSLKLFVGGVRVLTAYDTTPSLATGGVGLLTSQGGSADNFVAFALGTNAGLPFTDTFTTATNGQLSSDWTERAGAVTVASGVATASGVSLATLNGVTVSDAVVTATLPPPSAAFAGLGLVARYQSSGNFYWGALNRYPQDASQFMAVIWKYENGVATPVNLNTAVLPISQAVNGTLRFEVLGASLKLYLNDVIVSFAFDTTFTTGGVGMQLTNGAIVDNFTAAVRAATTPTVPGFADTFTAGGNPQNTLSLDWQERSGAFSVSSTVATANRATGLSTGQPNLAVANGNTALTDATVAADLFFTGAGQSAGLALRYQGTNGTGDRNFYFADLVTQANGDALVRIVRDVNGTKTVLGSTTVVGYFPGANFSPVTAPRLQFRVVGNQLSVFLDNLVTPLVSVVDNSFATGSVGIRTSVGAGVDNFLTS